MLQAKEGSSSAVLIERGESFFVYEPTLGIVTSGDTAEDAYRKFVDARRDLMAEVERAGLTINRTVPSASAAAYASAPAARGVPARSFLGELGLFSAKLFIVLLLVGIAGSAAVRGLSKSVDGLAAGINQALAPLSSIMLSDVVRKAGDVARDAQSLTPEQRDSLRRSIGILSRELEPLAEAWRHPLAQGTGN